MTDEPIRYKISDKTWHRISDAFNKAAYIHRKGEYKAEYLTDDDVKPLIDETYNAFTEAIDYGLKDNEIPTAMRMYLQDNVFVFSGFKAHTELRQASALLRDASGQIKPFNRFLSDIQKIDKTYNKTYLQAEYNFAVALSQAAARWQEISEGGDDFLLQYRTAKDERVREQHRILDGITLPPSDKFWDEFFPPNGWNCFVPGTPVLTPNGWKPIETIAKGDLVIGGSGKYRVVIGVHATPIDDELISIRSKRLVSTSTKNHRYLTSRGWVTADRIQLGDIIIQVAESSLQQQFINAVHNSSIILRQLFMSLIRERKSGTTFAVDNQIQFRHEKISNKSTTKSIAHKIKMFLNQHLEDLHFRRGQRFSQRTHSLRVSFARSKRGLQGFIPYFLTKKGRFLLELIGNLANQLAILFVFSLSYMLSLPCKAAICFCKAFAGFSSSHRIVNPLCFNRFSSMSDWYSAVIKHSCNRSIVNPPCFAQPSNRSHLCDVPELCGIDNIHSFNGFNSFYDFLRRTFLHCNYNLVTSKDTKKYTTTVYNLSVTKDESYIVPLGITHNCRCTAVQVNPRRYPESDPEEALQRGRAATFQPNANGQNKAAIFRFNAGKNKIIFSCKHPYFKALEKLPQGIYTEEKIGDGRIFWREQQKDNEFGENEHIAKFLARKYGYDIELLPVINENGIKTADSYNYTLGVKQEYKQVTSINSLSMRLRKGAKQAGYVVLNVIEPHSKFEIIKAVKGRFNLTPELRAVHIITSDDDYILYR